MKYPPEILMVFILYPMRPSVGNTYLYIDFSPKITIGFKHNNTIILIYREVSHNAFFKTKSILHGINVNDKVDLIFLKKIVELYQDLKNKIFDDPNNLDYKTEFNELVESFKDLKTVMRNSTIDDILG